MNNFAQLFTVEYNFREKKVLLKVWAQNKEKHSNINSDCFQNTVTGM
jgi:hypothetical protein